MAAYFGVVQTPTPFYGATPHPVVAAYAIGVDALRADQWEQAAQNLRQQAVNLDNQYKNASAPVQYQLRLESQNLRLRATELENNDYTPSSRKALQNESWNTMNSKAGW
jgi:hypothetical protein